MGGEENDRRRHLVAGNNRQQQLKRTSTGDFLLSICLHQLGLFSLSFPVLSFLSILLSTVFYHSLPTCVCMARKFGRGLNLPNFLHKLVASRLVPRPTEKWPCILLTLRLKVTKETCAYTKQ